MRILYHISIFVMSCVFFMQITPSIRAQDSLWLEVEEGLFIGRFPATQKSIIGDSKITIIKISPCLYSFNLLCVGELNHPNLTVKEWCGKYNLIGAINAGMYQQDYRSNVGYMKNFTYTNNATINSKYFSVAAFNPVDAVIKPFQIFDIDTKDMNEIISNYDTVIQNLRLIKKPSQNRWARQNKKWSEAALGQDTLGNVLFIFSRSPYSMYDFNHILLNLPIHLSCAQHLEGGPEASLYFSYKDIKIEEVGSYETDFTESHENTSFWPIPNVIGFVKKEEKE